MEFLFFLLFFVSIPFYNTFFCLSIRERAYLVFFAVISLKKHSPQFLFLRS